MPVVIRKREEGPASAKKSVGPNTHLVLGIDVSTKTGIVLMGDRSIVIEREIQLPVLGKDETDPVQRCLRAARLGMDIIKILEQHKPNIVFVEGYSFASKFNQGTMIELGAAVRFGCIKCGVKFVEVTPTSLKKYATGNGDAQKNMVMMKVLSRFGYEAKTDNIADAYVLARIGLMYQGFIEPTNAYERELKAKLLSKSLQPD